MVERPGDPEHEFGPLPLEVVNALLVPVYEALGESDAFDGKADEVVRQQLRFLTEAGYVLAPAAVAAGTGSSEAERRGEIEQLLKDWLHHACGTISEFSGAPVKDWRGLRAQAIERADRLNIEWSDDLVPEHVLEALAWDDYEQATDIGVTERPGA